MWCDSSLAIALASNPVFHARTKHIETDYHFIREKVLINEISLRHVSSEAQVADIFTKSLSVARFQVLRSKFMVGKPPTIRLRGKVSDASVS